MQLANRFWTVLCSLVLISIVSADLPTDGQTGTAKWSYNPWSKVEFSYTWHWESRNFQNKFSITCSRPCNGEKHESHEKCDLSCDGPCDVGAHYFSPKPEIIEISNDSLDPPITPHATTVNRDFEESKMPGTMNARQMLRTLFQIERTYATGITLPREVYFMQRPDHWNEHPCSSSSKKLLSRNYILEVDYTVMGASDDLKTWSEAESGKIRFLVKMPLKDQWSDEFIETSCRCEPKEETTEDHGFFRDPTNPLEDYAYVEFGDKTELINANNLIGFVDEFEVPNMNYTDVTFGHSLPMGNLHIPAGWELRCVKGDGQDVQLQEDLNIDGLFVEGSWLVNINPTSGSKAAVRLRTLCLDIDKPEPDLSMTYKLVPPKRRSLIALARMTRESRFRGPWDQMRLWTATDFATYKKIESVLLPAPSEARYVHEMRRAVMAGALDTSDERFGKMLEAEHLFTSNAYPESAAWLMSALMELDEKKAAKDIKSMKKRIAEYCSSAEATEAVSLISGIVEALTAGELKDSVESALWLVSEAIPDSLKSEIGTSDGAFALAEVLTTTDDEDLASNILDWVASDKPVAAVHGCFNMNEELTESLRDRGIQMAIALAPKRSG